MKQSFIIVLLCITSLLAGKNKLLRKEFPAEFFHHTNERSNIFFEEGTIAGSQHLRLSKGNLLYNGTLQDIEDSSVKSMFHRVTFATKTEKSTYAFFLEYESEKIDTDWYYETIFKKRNTLLAGFSLRRELSSQRALNFVLSSRTSFDKGEEFYHYKNYFDDNYWILTYKNYNSPNVTESLDVNIGYIRYLQTKRATPLVLVHDIKWNFTTHREGNPMNSELLLYYMNNPMVEEFTMRSEDWDNHQWTLRSSLLSVKRDARKIYHLSKKDDQKSFTMNLNLLSLWATRSIQNVKREDLVYAEYSEHSLTERKTHITEFGINSDIDLTLFKYGYLGATYKAHLETQEWYDPRFRFTYEITPYVGLRAALLRTLFLNVKMDIITLDRQHNGIRDSWGLYTKFLYYDRFPFAVSLSYTF